MEVSKKRKAFQHIYSALFQHQIKFTLAYPAVLLLCALSSDQLTFQDPTEAESFLRLINPEAHSNLLPRVISVSRPLDQWRPRKDPPKMSQILWLQQPCQFLLSGIISAGYVI